MVALRAPRRSRMGLDSLLLHKTWTFGEGAWTDVPPTQTQTTTTQNKRDDTITIIIIMDRLSFLGKRRSPPSSSSSSSNSWTVVRLGAKDAATRKQEGDAKSCQRKTACDTLTIRSDGVQGVASSSWWSFWTNWSSSQKKKNKTVIQDYNHYRSQGHSGRFDAGTNDRAVSIATVSAYTKLETALGRRIITYGDLGENILLDDTGLLVPAAAAAPVRLAVGTRVRLGSTVVLEITEVNNPCYRFTTQTWAAAAQAKWGATSPDGCLSDHWFQSPECPLNHEVNPGIRGWLAKVITEGEVATGDTAMLVSSSEGHDDDDKGTEEKAGNAGTAAPKEEESAQPSPTKKRKTSKAKKKS